MTDEIIVDSGVDPIGVENVGDVVIIVETPDGTLTPLLPGERVVMLPLSKVHSVSEGGKIRWAQSASFLGL